MKKARRHFSGAEKVGILKRHLIDKVAASDLCDEYDLYPTQFYSWLKEFFENGHVAFENGHKYTKPDGLVSIKMDLDDGYVSVDVTDTGIGISAERLPRIFDRFFRADPSRTGETGGVGLGLSICQSIVKRLGGTLSATSWESIGTTFRVRLPISPLNENG